MNLTPAPFPGRPCGTGELLIQGIALGTHHIAQRLEEAP